MITSEQDGVSHLVFLKKTSISGYYNGIIVLKHALKSIHSSHWRINMHHLKIGDQFTSELIVEERHTAAAFGSGNLFVFSTPMMIGLMENAALKCAEAGLEEAFSTVGTHVDVKHMAATPMGQKVTATAELIEIDDKKLLFKVEAYDEVEKIGEGLHGRYIIHAEKFLKRVNQKAENK